MTELLTSKKFVTTVGAVATVIAVKVAGKFGIVLDTESANQITMLVGMIVSTYLISQGISDHGKEAVQKALDAGASPKETLNISLGNKTS